jgi:hypothetical protein
MIELYAAGVLEEAETFPPKIDSDRVAKLELDDYYNSLFHRDNLAALEERDLAPDLQQALRECLARAVDAPKPGTMHRVFRTVEYLDHSYARGAVREVARRVLRRRY